MSVAGGLTYHWRALRNRKRWQPFCDFVDSWLANWAHPPFSRLVLIGPNAGYTLPDKFIKKFSQVVVIEPDPAAYLLFNARFQCQAVWVKTDYFGLDEKPPRAQKLAQLFTAFPNSVFLFCNILGQLPVLLREQKVDGKGASFSNDFIEDYMNDLAEVLHAGCQTHCVASYHDRYSRDWRKPDYIVDHLTKDLFPKSMRRKEFPWKLTSRFEHQVEFVRTDDQAR